MSEVGQEHDGCLYAAVLVWLVLALVFVAGVLVGVGVSS